MEIEAFVERLGEKTLSLLSSFLEKIKSVGEKIKVFRDEILEKRGIELKDYAILKLEIFSMLFLFLSAVFIFSFPVTVSPEAYFILGALLLLACIYILFGEVQRYFGEDFPAYRDFFLSYLSLGMLLIIVKITKPVISFAFPYFHYVLVSVAGVFLISLLFKKRHARDYTFGRVLEADFDLVKVKINYDIKANVKPMKYAFKNKFGAKRGDVVKISVKKRFFGSVPEEITGVHWS